MAVVVYHADRAPHLRTSSRELLIVPLLCGLIMMLLTFSLVERESGNDVDWIAKCKVAGRAVCGLLFLGLLTWQRCRPSLHFATARSCWLILFIGWAVVSTMWSPLRTISLGQSGSLAILLLMSLAIAMLWKDERDTSFILSFVSLSLLFICAMLLVLRIAVPASGSLQRVGEGLLHATNGAATASLGILILLVARLKWRWLWARLLFVPGLCVYAAVLVFAANRTSLALTFLLSAGLVFVATNRKIWSSGLMLLCGVFVLYLTVDPGLRLVGSGGEGVEEFLMRGQSLDQLRELSGRNELWTTVWSSFLESPWIGHGYFMTSSTGEIEVWYREGNFPAHNIWLQALATTGVIGALLFVIGLLTTYGKTNWTLWRASATRPMALLMTTVGCWYLGWSLTSDSILGPVQPETVVFFTLLGIGLGSEFQLRRLAGAKGRS
ncbi:O-antigen ligase family protein [Rubinisphaera margarita]|uniref:O-antigen ligase family protein n=1 Tax=Rubinisphaera margarita TaxID=2909586 RepID=UPI001EE83A14|nr:O-antigen ligase family protein [Rubinisphaera margarita]MCG6155269.1 O-antigen ligase family protein [Rubinisphaera margarita]